MRYALDVVKDISSYYLLNSADKPLDICSSTVDLSCCRKNSGLARFHKDIVEVGRSCKSYALEFYLVATGGAALLHAYPLSKNPRTGPPLARSQNCIMILLT